MLPLISYLLRLSSLTRFLHSGVPLPILSTLQDFHSFQTGSGSRREICWSITLFSRALIPHTPSKQTRSLSHE